jgi:hypothetical protein
MLGVGLHAEPSLPLSTSTATVVLVVGLVVVALIAYDAYRQGIT